MRKTRSLYKSVDLFVYRTTVNNTEKGNRENLDGKPFPLYRFGQDHKRIYNICFMLHFNFLMLNKYVVIF